MSDQELMDALDNAPIAFGLVAQGHIPTIEKMLDEGKDWGAIGKAIGWEPLTAAKYYVRYLLRGRSCGIELLKEAADSVHASLAETDISDDRRNYRIDLERRLREYMK